MRLTVAILSFALTCAAALAQDPPPSEPAKDEPTPSEPAKDEPAKDGKGDKDADKRDSRFDYPKTQAHGGEVVKKGELVFEVVCREDWVRLYVTDALGQPVSAKKLGGGKLEIACVRPREAGGFRRRRTHQATSARLDYVAPSKSKGRTRDFVVGGHKLGSPSEDTWLRCTFELENVEPFTVEFRGPTPEYVFTCQDAECDEQHLPDPGECKKCGGELARRRIGEYGEVMDAQEAAEVEDREERRARNGRR